MLKWETRFALTKVLVRQKYSSLLGTFEHCDHLKILRAYSGVVVVVEIHHIMNDSWTVNFFRNDVTAFLFSLNFKKYMYGHKSSNRCVHLIMFFLILILRPASSQIKQLNLKYDIHVDKFFICMPVMQELSLAIRLLIVIKPVSLFFELHHILSPFCTFYRCLYG